MTIKRGIIIFASGLAIEVAILWAIDHFAHLGLVARIGWTSALVWGYFLTGFLTAHWLILWKRLIDKIMKFKKTDTIVEQPISTPVPASAQRLAPARMAVQNNAVLSVNPAQGTQVTPSANSSLSTTPTTPAVSQRTQDIEDLCNLKGDLDLMTFKHVNLEGHNIDLVFSSDSCALLCAIFSDEHTWTIDTSVSIENSLWTDETGQTKNPCLLLLQQAAALEKMEPDSTLIPTIIFMRGTIQNAEEAIPYLQEHHITVATYQADVMPNVETIGDLLTTYFTPFPPQYEDLVPPEEEEETPSNQPEGDNNV